MEPVIGFVLIVGALIWDHETSKVEDVHDVVAVEQGLEIQESNVPETQSVSVPQPTYYGYKVKDLSVRKEVPEGCNRPVLTSDLSGVTAEGSLRIVNEVKTSCEG